jgi:hypothetical protein
MTTIAIFEILDSNNKVHRLLFNLYESSLAKRWRVLVERNMLEGGSLHSSFINLTFDKISEVITELNKIVLTINNLYDRTLPQFINLEVLDQQILNDLHEEYEIYGNRVDEFEPGILHDSFLRLNELIHTCEEMLITKDKPFIPMSVLADFFPVGIHEPLQDIDKLYLTTEFNWGKLYLGYNTLGKDWLEVQRHNDVDVILRNQVRPQERFAAEFWLNFTQDDTCKWNVSQFEKWYNTLTDDVKEKVPLHNLNELSLGRYEIGTLSITDYFLKYHNNIHDWRSPENPIKAKWNKEVFSTFKSIKRIQFKNV